MSDRVIVHFGSLEGTDYRTDNSGAALESLKEIGWVEKDD